MKTVIVIGSGPGGTAAALKILEAGHKVIMLERGGFLPKEDENRDSLEVYGETRYRTKERWSDAKKDEKLQPWMHYYVGGNAKLYGAALYRFRPADFGELHYPDGISPAWPHTYEDFAPYYDEAEALYDVRGRRSADATEPHGEEFPHPPLEDEEYVTKIRAGLDAGGIATHPLPLGVSQRKNNKWDLDLSKFDAYPDPSLNKGEPEAKVLPILQSYGEKFQLRPRCLVTHFQVGEDGRIASVVYDDPDGGPMHVEGDCYVLAAGAINSARLILQTRERNDCKFLSSNDLVGANYMAHVSTTATAHFGEKVNLKFGKTFASNHWYQPDETEPILGGTIQTQGKWDADQYELEEWTRESGEPQQLADEAMEFFFTTEDLPKRENRISIDGDQLSITRELTNLELHEQTVKEFQKALTQHCGLKSFTSQVLPLAWCTHQCGTLVYGNDPKTSVLNADCRAHDCENLYVTDASFFPSSSALNPTLTTVANSLRVGEIIGAQ